MDHRVDAIPFPMRRNGALIADVTRDDRKAAVCQPCGGLRRMRAAEHLPTRVVEELGRCETDKPAAGDQDPRHGSIIRPGLSRTSCGSASCSREAAALRTCG